MDFITLCSVVGFFGGLITIGQFVHSIYVRVTSHKK